MSTDGSIHTPREVFASRAWMHIAEWAQAQIQTARERNDNTALDAAATAALRGEVRALKRLLDLATPPAPAPHEAHGDYLT